MALTEYQLESVLNFGKYKGKSIRTIAEWDPSYLDWCAKTVAFFCISEDTITLIESIDGTLFGNKFKFSEQALVALNEKSEKFDVAIEQFNDSSDDYMNDNWEEDNFYALTDGMEGDWDECTDMDDVWVLMRG